MKKQKKMHIGGEQLPMFLPESDWKRPATLPDLRHLKQIAMDTENRDEGLKKGKGPGWAIGDGHVCGVSVAWRADQVYSNYFPIRHPDSDCFTPDQVGRWIKDHAKAGVKFIFHTATYDVGWINNEWKIPPSYPVGDTGCMAYICDENRLSYSLNSLCKWRGLPGKDESLLREVAACYGMDPKSDLWKFPARYVGGYAEQDAHSTLLLAEDLELEIDRQDVRAAYELEMDLLPMVHEMRRRGVRIDMDATERIFYDFKAQSASALQEISDRLELSVGMDEIRSNKWLTKVFDSLHIDYPITKKTGAPSFEAKWMKDHEHWLPKLIVRAKSREEAAEKFVKGYIVDFSTNGRLHASVHQFKSENLTDEDGYGGGTRTYRFSYSDPPLQQIPHRDEELMKKIRGAFVAELGELWASADYSQQEYRLIVHYAELMKFAKASEAADRYRTDPNTDFHSMVAEMTGLDRKPAKDCNFAKAYGAGVDKFAFMIKKSRKEAEAIMTKYDEKMPFVKQLYDKCQSEASKRGHIRLLDGAKIRFDWWVAKWRSHDVQWTQQNAQADCQYDEAIRRINDPTHPWYQQKMRRSRCNKAMNSLIQGGAARQTKIAMRDCYREGHVPLLQVHDELCFSIYRPEIGDEIAEIMRNAVELRVPMKVDVDVGSSWAG
jgi:Mesyanzhinovviridae DNA polymerase